MANRPDIGTERDEVTEDVEEMESEDAEMVSKMAGI